MDLFDIGLSTLDISIFFIGYIYHLAQPASQRSNQVSHDHIHKMVGHNQELAYHNWTDWARRLHGAMLGVPGSSPGRVVTFGGLSGTLSCSNLCG